MKKLHFKISKLILILILVFTEGFWVEQPTAKPNHDFYLSICEIIYKPETQSLEITFRFFSDDLEKTIFNFDQTSIYTYTGDKSSKSDTSLYNYLRKHFSIYDKDGKRIDYAFIGWEVNKETSWCYVEVKHKQISKLKVENNLLTELFKGQKNLVYFKSGNIETSVLLDKNKIIGELSLDL